MSRDVHREILKNHFLQKICTNEQKISFFSEKSRDKMLITKKVFN